MGSDLTLISFGRVVLHAGGRTDFKIDCDALTQTDLDALAIKIARTLTFGRVYGIPRGGERLAAACQEYVTPDSPYRLVVDDVCTTGMSMREVYEPGDVGVVIFARGLVPAWVVPIFRTSFF